MNSDLQGEKILADKRYWSKIGVACASYIRDHLAITAHFMNLSVGSFQHVLFKVLAIYFI